MKKTLNLIAAAALSTAMAFAAVGGGSLPASAAPDPGGVWGPQGKTTGSEPVTVRWDNQGNPVTSAVPRDASQKLPHTAGKTYDDVAQDIRAFYNKTFGKDNGAGGLTMTVSQTKDLVNQTVSVRFTGLTPNTSGGSEPRFLQVFQCWGAPGADGKPDPNATSPDPATCQVGAGGLGDPRGSQWSSTRTVFKDPLVSGGDWGNTVSNPDYPNQPPFIPTAPFTAIDGKSTVSPTDRGAEYKNPYFNATTTNEVSRLSVGTDGTTQAEFEMQTGAEAQGLGCGARSDAPSIPSCWLVAVPRSDDYAGLSSASADVSRGTGMGPVSPSLWAQRMQVKLSFQDAPGFCSGATARTIVPGSELLKSSMDSWVPAMCQEGIGLGYTLTGDLQARSQLAPGTAALVTGQAAEAVHAPVSIAGVALAFNFDMKSRDAAGGYVGRPMPEIRLNARLLAKQLTQTYQNDMVRSVSSDLFRAAIPWYFGSPPAVPAPLKSLFLDPEFAKLNPGLSAEERNSAAIEYRLAVENLRSDAAAALWNWIVSDKDARAFLDGCPDTWGTTINPFYSTRAYSACSDQKTALENAAAAKRDQTLKPSTLAAEPPVYPSDTAAFPQTGWYEFRQPILKDFLPVFDAKGFPVPDPKVDPLTMSAMFPAVGSMAEAGREAGRAVYPSGVEWCSKLTQCVPPDFPKEGKWKTVTAMPDLGSRAVMAITDTATAAKYQTRTAQLCNTEGTQCVGASEATLSKAASKFNFQDPANAFAAGTTPDYAGGAYPLALPVYQAVNMKGITVKEANAYATTLDYMTTKGQVPGTRSGQLPPGYAPLTPAMKARAAAVIADLRAVKAPGSTDALAAVEAPAGAISPLSQGTSAKVDTAAPPTNRSPLAALAPASSSSGLSPVAKAVKNAAAKKPAGTAPAAKPQQAASKVDTETPGKTPSASASWTTYGLLIALGVGLAAALAAPLVGRLGRGKGA